MSVVATELFKKDDNIVATWMEDGRVILGVKEKSRGVNKLALMELPTETPEMREIGEVVALQLRTEKWRPAPGGVSIGHYAITAGTLGCVVRKEGKRMILSNNHVLANSNNANPGDVTYQPGPYDITGGDDGGCIFSKGVAGVLNFVWTWLAPLILWRKVTTRFKTYDSDWSQYVIAHLESFHPIDFSDSGVNKADCALAIPISGDVVLDEILDVGIPKYFGGVQSGDVVIKSGRTTGFTTGTVTSSNVTVKVKYPSGRYAIFEDQIGTGNMVSGGDSGSLLLRGDKETAVGLVFAGSNKMSFMNKISNVQEALGGFVLP